MSKIAKILLIAILAFLGLAVAAAAILAATFDPNDYKPRLVRLVQEKWQRTLEIPGDIRLTFFPRLGADLGRVSISEYRGDGQFAAIESARVSLELLPLLSRELVVHQVRINGLTANLKRHADGSTNYDDLLSAESQQPQQPQQPPAQEPEADRQPFRLNIDGIAIREARLRLDDAQSQRQIELAVARLETGKIANGVPGRLTLDAALRANQPALDAAFSIKTGFTFDSAQGSHTLRDLDARLAGTLDGRPFETGLKAPELALAGDRLSAGMLHVQLKSGQPGGAPLEGRIDTPLSADLQARRFELGKIAAAFVLPSPAGGTLKLDAGGNASLDLSKDSASAALKGKLDESGFDAKLGLRKLSPPSYTFDIAIDRFDADRYRAKPAAAPPAAKAPEPAGQGQSGPKQSGPEQPVDLSALRDLRASGSLRVGALKVANIQASDVRLQLRAADGKLQIDPLTASLYGGSASGALSATAGKTPAFTLRQTLTGIHIGPLLDDALGQGRIEGRGNVSLDVATAGATSTQMKNALDGTARLALRDGALRGINLAQAIRGAKARIGALRGKPAPQEGKGSAVEKTDFSELSASFRIEDGVARNTDLDAKSPLLRLTGAGAIDLGASSLDYTVKTAIVSTLEGQGGAELEELKGLTVPVRLWGPFDSLNWRVDFQGLAAGLAEKKIEEKKAEAREKAEKALEKQKGRLEERLKGLFGK